MAKGKIDVTPEVFANIEAWLPRGVTVASAETHGGAKRLEIEGTQIGDGVQYQLVVTDHDHCRTIELKDGSYQPFNTPTPLEQAKAEVAKMDHDGDGKVGGSLKGRKVKPKPKAAKKKPGA
ncbi:MAG: hypothetical protein M3Q75_04265 [Gemmatimonadota bacterium]|nr:hypothetical protein [Gemmatimonadota bacterium]